MTSSGKTLMPPEMDKVQAADSSRHEVLKLIFNLPDSFDVLTFLPTEESREIYFPFEYQDRKARRGRRSLPLSFDFLFFQKWMH